MLQDYSLDFIQEEFEKKNAILEQFGEWVSAADLYEALFDDLDLLMPVVLIDDDENKHMVKMTIGEALDQAESRNDILLGACTYFNEFVSKATTKEVRGLIIDMDNVYAGVLLSALQKDWNTEEEELPKPTYIVNSGTGLHLYFVFDEPIPYYRCNRFDMDNLYRRLAVQQTTARIYYHKQVQWFGQDFRMAGSLNKYNWRNETFRVGERWNIDKLAVAVGLKNVHFVRYGEKRTKKPQPRVKSLNRPMKRTGWRCNRGFYNYTLNRCRNETKEGTRYMSFCALTVIAWKCNVPIDELERDLYSLIPIYNEGAKRQMKESEVKHALKMYNEKAMLTQRERLEDWIGWEYKPIQRNGRTRKEHLQAEYWRDNETGRRKVNVCRQNRELALLDMRENGEIEGRPKGSGTAKNIVIAWKIRHPNGRKADCVRDTGLSKPTVYKWWKTDEAGE